MNLMGLTDDHFPTEADGMDWPCPVSSEELDVFVNASSHLFFQELFKEGVADGFVQKEKLAEAIGRAMQGDYEQCNCAANRKLLDSTLPECDIEDLKQLIRTPPTLSQATGNMFAVALLRQLFKAMGLPTFRPRATGSVGSVSYVLLHKTMNIHFGESLTMSYTKICLGQDTSLWQQGKYSQQIGRMFKIRFMVLEAF